MTSTQNPNRLHTQLAHMIALEAAIEQRLEELIEKAESSGLDSAEKDELRKLRPYGSNPG